MQVLRLYSFCKKLVSVHPKINPIFKEVKNNNNYTTHRWQHEQHVKGQTGVAVPVLARSAPGGKGQKVGLEVVCQSRAGHTPGGDNTGL